MPPEVEWFANISNHNTRRVYENAVKDFMRFAGIARPEEFRAVTRAHIIAWRDELARRGLGGATIRNRLAPLASLFEYLCEKNAVTHNPVKGVERPRAESGEGKTPALGDHQARKLLDAPDKDTIKSKRDRAILSTLLFHALRREELCKLKVKDFRHARTGVPHLKVSGKGGKTRYLPLTSSPARSCLLFLHPALRQFLASLRDCLSTDATFAAECAASSLLQVHKHRQQLPCGVGVTRQTCLLEKVLNAIRQPSAERSVEAIHESFGVIDR